MRCLLFSTLLLAVTCSSAMANYYQDGNKLSDYCAMKGVPFAEGMCAGYIVGATDAFEIGRVLKGQPFCLRQGILVEQIVDVVKKYLSDHPEFRDVGGANLVEAALTQAFCKANQ